MKPFPVYFHLHSHWLALAGDFNRWLQLLLWPQLISTCASDMSLKQFSFWQVKQIRQIEGIRGSVLSGLSQIFQYLTKDSCISPQSYIFHSRKLLEIVLVEFFSLGACIFLQVQVSEKELKESPTQRILPTSMVCYHFIVHKFAKIAHCKLAYKLESINISLAL